MGTWVQPLRWAPLGERRLEMEGLAQVQFLFPCHPVEPSWRQYAVHSDLPYPREPLVPGRMVPAKDTEPESLLPTWMVVIPTSRPTRTLLSCRVAMCGDSSFMKSATRWVMSNCQSGLRRWLSWPQGPAPSDTNWVRTRTVACWNCRAQPRPLCSSSSSSSLSRVGLCGRKGAVSDVGGGSIEHHKRAGVCLSLRRQCSRRESWVPMGARHPFLGNAEA